MAQSNATLERRALIPFALHSFLGGQSDYENKGIAGSYKASYGLDIRKQKDTLSGQQILKDDLAVGVMDAPCYFVVTASDGQTYFFTNNGKIWRRDASGSYLIQGYGVIPIYTETHESGNIIGAAEWYDNAGNTYLLWATPTRLNIKRIIGTGYTNHEVWNDVNTVPTGSWPKTNLTSADFHTMAMANGVMQICNGNLMALVGYDMSYTNNSLELIPGNASRLVLERGKYAVIGCRRIDGKDETQLFDWDGIGLSWNDKEIIKFGGINSMIDTEIALAQIGTNGQLYVTDFNTPVPFRQIRGGGKSDPDGMCSYHGMALVGIYGNTNLINGHYANGIYTVGRINKNAPLVLNLEYQLDCDEIYSVKTIGTDIIVVYKYNNQYGVKIVDTDNKSDWVYQSLDLIAPIGTLRYPIPLGRLVNWARVDLQCEPLLPGTAIEVWYKIDKATTGGANNDGWIQANMDTSNTDGGLQFKDKGLQNAIFYIGQKGRTCEIMVKGLRSGSRTPEVNEINIYISVG